MVIANLPTLDTLKPRQQTQVSHVEGDAQQRRRLMEMGFVPGCLVTYEMPTPFGDPLVYSLRGTTIALRRGEARCVRIRT